LTDLHCVDTDLANRGRPKPIFHYNTIPLTYDTYDTCGALVSPVNAVQDLGVFIDNDLGAATHVRRTVSRCFATLRQLRHLRRYVTDDCFRSLVVSLVHSRLDYDNFVLVGLPV